MSESRCHVKGLCVCEPTFACVDEPKTDVKTSKAASLL